MADAIDATGARVTPGTEAEDRRAAAAVIGAHSLQHFYQQGFFVLLPAIYSSLGLTPISAGVLEMVRRGAGGVMSVGGGIAVDRFPDRRIPLLYVSLMAMGLGYMAAGLAPTYAIIVVAAGLAGGAGSVWHPAALGLLSQVFPRRRGFMISMHRSSGSIGDATGPLVVGGLLTLVSWQTVLIGALPLAVTFALCLWVLLLKAPSWTTRRETAATSRTIGAQFRDLGVAVRNRGLLLLLVVGAFSGLGQGGLIMWLSLYLDQALDMGSVGIGVHVALLTGLGIVAGPLVGGLSDRTGRKPVIVGVMAFQAVFAAGMALTGSGLVFTVFVALMGAVMFGVNSLIQAAALDLTEGRQLEGSMIGMLWGLNAVFAGLSPLLVGFLVAALGYGIVFWYAAVMNVCGTIAAMLLPALRKPASGATTTR